MILKDSLLDESYKGRNNRRAEELHRLHAAKVQQDIRRGEAANAVMSARPTEQHRQSQ